MFKFILRFCFVLLATVLLFPSTGTAQTTQWPDPEKAVLPDKQWKISFSAQVDASSVNSDTVYVSTVGGNKIVVNAFVSPDNPNLVIVETPSGGYDLGETYILYIDQSISSYPENERLKSNVEMKFSIISSEYHQLVQGTWDTTYLGYSIKATFRADYTSEAVVPNFISSTGYYSLDGSIMTVRMFGRTVTGEITKVSDREFYITSASGSVMHFTK